MGWQNMLGAVLSTTVTMAVAVAWLPLASVTVRVTVFGPTLAQVKLRGDTLRVRLLAAVQLSLLPLFTAAAVSVARPRALKVRVVLRVMTTGAVLSTTVTVAVAVLALPLASVTVSVTGLAPRLAQVKLEGDTLSVRLAGVQLSLLPLFTAAANRVAEPLAPRLTVTFWATAVGAIAS